MNPFFRFMQKLGGHTDDAAAGMDPLFQKALERERRILASARADTGRQWQNLARRLENPRTLTGVTRARLRIRWAMAGAAVASIASAAIVISLLSVRDPAGATYHTARGEQSTVVLADSSQILLNHTTEMSVSPAEEGRLVRLEGEAFFRVRKTGEPFVVTTRVGTVRVLGTEFNVRVRNDILEVAVKSGSVRVSTDNGGRESSVVLSGGERTLFARGEAPGTPESLLFADYPGWMHGKLLVQKLSVSAVCREIESKFDVTISVESARLRQETITGALDARTPEAAIATIARLTGSAYKYEKNAYILY